jgi:nicotinamide-nucleotide amidase
LSIKHGEIIAIGDELISGRVLNTTSCFAADRLFNAGYAIKRITVIGDDPDDINECLLRAVDRSSFVIISGGLGPTSDDITNEVAAKALGRRLVRNEGIMKRLEECRASGRCPADFPMDKLAMLPEAAEELNPSGHAAGYYLRHNGVILFFLPGVPEQLREHLIRRVLPTLEKINGRQPGGLKKTFRIFGRSEIELNMLIAPIDRKYRDIKVGYYPNFPEVFVSLSMLEDRDGKAYFDSMCREVRALLAENITGEDDETLEKNIGRLLIRKKARLAVAESCTGGMMGRQITSVPGSSAWFEMGVVTYANNAKRKLLGVSEGTLAAHGAVSSETAAEMAEGVRKLAGSDYALSITGIAGPGGGSEQKPVGTVFIGMTTPEKTVAERFLFQGRREQIRTISVAAALDWLRRHLSFGSYIPGIKTAA